MRIKMEEPADVLRLVTPDLAVEEAGLGTLGALCAPRGEAAVPVEAVGLEETAQRSVGRDWSKIGIGLGQCCEIVVVQLRAPAFVCGVLGDECLAYRAADRRLPSGIDAQLAAQHPDGIAPLLQRPVVPALDRREAETGMLIGYGMMPRAIGEGSNRSGEFALPRRCRQ